MGIELLTADNVAKALQVTTVILRRWCKAGEFPSPLTIGANSIRWRISDIETWLDSLAADAAERPNAARAAVLIDEIEQWANDRELDDLPSTPNSIGTPEQQAAFNRLAEDQPPPGESPDHD